MGQHTDIRRCTPLQQLSLAASARAAEHPLLRGECDCAACLLACSCNQAQRQLPALSQQGETGPAGCAVPCSTPLCSPTTSVPGHPPPLPAARCAPVQQAPRPRCCRAASLTSALPCYAGEQSAEAPPLPPLTSCKTCLAHRAAAAALWPLRCCRPCWPQPLPRGLRGAWHRG